MAYNQQPSAPRPHDVARQQAYDGYDDPDHPYVGDIQDNPHLQNPNVPPNAGYNQYQNPAPLQGYQTQYAASQASFDHHPAGAYPYGHQERADSVTGFHPNESAPSVRSDPFRDANPGRSAFNAGYSAEQSRFSSYPEKREQYDDGAAGDKQRRRRRIIYGSIAGVLVLAAIAGFALYWFVLKPKQEDSGSASKAAASGTPNKGNTTTSTTTKPVTLAVTGSDGSTVTMEDGTTFTYRNSFGGYWVADPAKPLDNSARAQSYSAPLNQSWNYGTDRIRGVNVGGWLVLEPFISPALFEKYPGTIDEFTLSRAMAADTASGGLSQIEEHYKTFITEKDFADIAGAGLNWVRLPIPFWAIETWTAGLGGADEPYLARVSWTYFLKAVAWARKYGLRINLDLHSAPGSQNGWNHSGHLGDINFMAGVMGIANAQRTITYLEILTQFISQAQYKDVIPMFSILNEAFMPTIGQPQMESFYMEAYTKLRAITGIGQGNGPMLAIHDGFGSLSAWENVFPNADRLALDTHKYFAFNDVPSSDPISAFVPRPCSAYLAPVTQSMRNFGVTIAGEFSLAINDCGLNVNGVGLGTRYEGTYVGNSNPGVGSCDQWTVWENYSADTKAQLRRFAMTQMDALQNYFFWTWHIGNSSVANSIRAPFWSYKLGLQQGWIPQDPRQADGACGAPGFSGVMQPWQTGGAGADQIPLATRSALAFPPTTLSNAGPAAALPTYTPTGTAITMPGPTFTGAPSVSAGDGWANDNVQVAAFVPIAGCNAYLEEYSGANAPLPTQLCGASAPAAGVAARSQITPAPVA